MHYRLIFTLLCLMPLCLSAQLQRQPMPSHLSMPVSTVSNMQGIESESVDQIPTLPMANNFLTSEVLVGRTLYDLQSNSAMASRLIISPNGEKTAAWIYSQSIDDTYPDRGTGINRWINGQWQAEPESRIESQRTGWPSLIQLGDGALHVTTHSSSNLLRTAKLAPGSSTWEESMIPNETPFGLFWPRSAAGGTDGNTIHVIALTSPLTENGGSIYDGVNGHLLYSRSLDGGTTWDRTDQIIPGLDSSVYRFMTADNYALVARDEVVAIIIFGEWGDIRLYKSIDNGGTWASTIINDFPLDGYSINDGYSVSDLVEDPIAPDSLAIYTSDGSGGAVIDADGMVHVTYADAYVLDDDTTDVGSSFYPGWSGISYWNESFTSTPALVGVLLDPDGNDTIDLAFDDIPRYSNSTTTSMPVIATDDQGGIFILYASVSEANYNELDEQNYRHIVAIRSEDNGQTWGEGYDIINPELADPELYEFVEAVYPSAYSYVDDTLHVLYQQDFFPGHRFIDSLDAFADNFMVYTPIPVKLIPSAAIVGVDEHRIDDQVKAYPTITSTHVYIEMDQSLGVLQQVRIYDLMGRLCAQVPVSGYRSAIDLSALAVGTYVLHIESSAGPSIKRIVRQ